MTVNLQHAQIKYSSLAQLAERMTVNHDVAGSSPAGGARKKHLLRQVLFSSNPKDWYGISPQVSM